MRKMIRLYALIALSSLAATGRAQQADTARRGPRVMDQVISNNGLNGNLFVHDPCMIREGDTYYVLSTGMGMKTSKDMIHWVNDGGVFEKDDPKPSWWGNEISGRPGLWAPDIHYAGGKYHLYYSVSAWMNFNSCIGYATNVTLDKNDPRYKWEDQGEVINHRNGGDSVNVIDPNVFTDEDGKEWLIYGSYRTGLRLVELDPRTGKPFSDKPRLDTITTSLGEGSYIIRGPKYYYVFASRGRCCAGVNSTYQIVVGRSKTVRGPYLNKEGKSWKDNAYSVFLAGDYNEPGRGHNGFFAQGDTTYIVYHAYTRSQNGASLLNIKPMYMDEGDWPSVEPTGQLFRMPEFEEKVFAGKELPALASAKVQEGAGTVAPKPLYSDPVYDGAADPVIVWNKQDKKWWMFYTNRRANDKNAVGVTWVHGTRIGIATSPDGAVWTYKDTANINYRPDTGYTHWAPEVIENDGDYHMFATYVPGIFSDWNHPRWIIHLTSSDLKNWKYESTLSLATERVIDPCIHRLADGTWRLWYNNEVDNKAIYYADSRDLYHWTDKGKAITDRAGEGPVAFSWKGHDWMIVDNWKGLGVYSSDDWLNWKRQEERLVERPGTGTDDQSKGGHADVVVNNDHAYLFYFTHPGGAGGGRRSVIQIAELKYRDDGTITCDGNEPVVIDLKGNDQKRRGNGEDD